MFPYYANHNLEGSTLTIVRDARFRREPPKTTMLAMPSLGAVSPELIS